MSDLFRLPHLPGAPPLPKLFGDEIFDVIRVTERTAANQNEVFGTYQNSVTSRQIKAFCAVSVGPERPRNAVLGEMWWHPRDGEPYIFLGRDWTPAKRLPAV